MSDEYKGKDWRKTPPVNKTMSIEEMKKRVADGLKRRQTDGRMLSTNIRPIATQADGPVLTKQQRRVLIQAAELAIYSLANNEREDYCGAIDAIYAVHRQAGIKQEVLVAMCKGIAEQAAELMGEDARIVDQVARTWLADYFTPSGKLISIAKGKGNGNIKKGADKADDSAKAPSGDGH